MATALVIGSGGREHALAWKLSRSPKVTRLIVAPGNEGFPKEWERWPVALAEGKTAFESLAKKAIAEKVDLTVVGPDNPLADGIVDVFASHGLVCFGPTAEAARLEASKAFAKEIMQAAGVPTANYFLAKGLGQAQEILRSVSWKDQGWVIKADGLALGKGVVVCSSQQEALEAAESLIKVSGQLVIEERLQGEEISWMAFCDGERCALLEPARDYKRLRDGDEGPNTGGMGAFSPVPGVPASFAARVRDEVFLPTLREMRRRGTPFRGLLYAGLMADLRREKFWVLEFNARFGDPETQVLMPRISGDVYDWFEASAKGDLGALPAQVPFARQAAVYIVGAARGYPEQPEKGKPIRGYEFDPRDPEFFCAGVSRNERGELVSNGGRVLGALALADTLESARTRAYERIRKITFDGMAYRSDIAK